MRRKGREREKERHIDRDRDREIFNTHGWIKLLGRSLSLIICPTTRNNMSCTRYGHTDNHHFAAKLEKKKKTGKSSIAS